MAPDNRMTDKELIFITFIDELFLPFCMRFFGFLFDCYIDRKPVRR